MELSLIIKEIKDHFFYFKDRLEGMNLMPLPMVSKENRGVNI